MRCHPLITTALLTTGGLLATPIPPAQAALFGQQSIADQQAVVVLRPLGSSRYDVLVIEEKQVGSQRCWRDRGNGIVEPLLLNFDFTGICDRATDSNGYSLRMGGEDLGLRYRLEVRTQESQALLVAVPFDGRGPTIPLGTTRSLTRDFLKVDLLPNWKLARRTYQGQPLGHYYFSAEQTLAAYSASNPSLVAIAPQRTPSASLRPATPSLLPSSGDQQPIPIPVVRLDQPNLSPSPTTSPTIPITPAPAAASPLRSPSSPAVLRPTPSTPSLRPLRPTTLAPTSPAPSNNPSPPDRFTISRTGQLSSDAFLVIVPVASGSSQELIQRIQQLGVPASNIFERGSREVALGPFRNRSLAEQWQSHLSQQGGLNGRVEFGR
ncbi:DUF3747 domain-containing protein [Synechococcus elongatus IITB7]|uniref:DUF3747 domain-containing protein n=1 Tax=Synechococcus elongatus TaxID=32046 RepID=UPI0030CD82A8